ncbi:MAG: Lrp/AsnC family transcriptional regulator [Thermoplasmatales archaeon]|nr:Lrp/AsnC family transcriptional regulator [Thermoplasmatales archaeon]
MPKSSRKQIDKDEKKVISELQKNAKESIDKIAKRCNFSRQKVWRIIKRLEKSKTIWGYAAIVNEEKQDLKHYIMLIKKTTLPIDEKLADKIVTRKLENIAPKTEIKIENSLYVHGVYDWIVSFTAEDIKQAKKFCEKFIELYRGYIAELNLLETLFSVKKQGVLNPKAIELKQFL